MPRKRTIPDQDLLDAALVVVRAAGPEALTFAAAAGASGLAASTLVQRFGTKAGLLRAALLRAWDLLDEQTAAAAAAAGPGAEGVVDMLVRLSGCYDAHDFADQLRVLREDLRDPVLRERGQRWLALLGQEVERRLETRGAGRHRRAGRGALAGHPDGLGLHPEHAAVRGRPHRPHRAARPPPALPERHFRAIGLLESAVRAAGSRPGRVS